MKLVWVDLEMSGLNPEKNVILEIAVIITDINLNVIEEGPDLIIHASDEELNNMSKWCTKQFGESGLTEKSRESTISIEDAEKQVLEFVKKHCTEKECYLAGNSVWMDKMFLMKHMPKVVDYMHYRIVDVTGIKLLAESWLNAIPPEKKLLHRAMDDIKESIEELKYYRKNVFKKSSD